MDSLRRPYIHTPLHAKVTSMTPVSRRTFIQTTAASTAAGLVTLSTNSVAAAPSSGVLYEGFPIPPRPGVQEVTTVNGPNDEYWMLFGVNRHLVRKVSKDGGRSWSDTVTETTASGDSIPVAQNNVHLSMLTLKSGRTAIVYGGPRSRRGRDGTVLFRTLNDDGKTWSGETAVDPLFAVCRTQGARVLSSGRIVVPVMKWISPSTGGESEGANENLTFSWVWYSDDEGVSWQRSLSELFVALDNGRRGITHFEEMVLEERSDKTLLMLGRTELGVFYKSYSKNGGISWSHPVPTDLANSYAPGTLIRIPKTGDMLLIWNQTSVQEIISGLHRHRLSTAISTDEGETWAHHRNLESLDDRTHIEPPSGVPRVYRMYDYAYRQPNPSEYPHAPGCLRICYATVAFRGNEAAITYDYGWGVGEFEGKHATRIKVVSLDWLYGRV